MSDPSPARTDTESAPNLSPDAFQRLGRIAWGVLVTAVTIALAVLCWSVFNAATGERQFADPISIALYYVAPAALALAGLVALRLSPLARLRLLAVLIAAVGAAYAAESILRFSNQTDASTPLMEVLREQNDRAAFAQKLTEESGRKVDARTSREVLAALEQTYGRAVPIITPPNHLWQRDASGRVSSMIVVDGAEVIPLAGPSRVATLLCNEHGDWIHYISDRHGFNNPDALWDSVSLDVAIVGDSFAHGYCVRPEDSFAGVVRRQYGKTLNLGIAGDGPLMALATLTHHLPRFAPRTVFWAYFEGNDLAELQTERQIAPLVRYLHDGATQPALADQERLDQAMLRVIPAIQEKARTDIDRRAWRGAAYAARTYITLTSLRSRLGFIVPTDTRTIEAERDFNGRNLEVFRQALNTARTRVDAWGGRLVFVYLPAWERYTSRFRSAGSAKRDQVLVVVSELGIPLVDIAPVFDTHPDPLSLFPFRRTGHYTEEGHRLVADALVRSVAVASQVPSDSKSATAPDCDRSGYEATPCSSGAATE
jgi:hypothetical protein